MATNETPEARRRRLERERRTGDRTDDVSSPLHPTNPASPVYYGGHDSGSSSSCDTSSSSSSFDSGSSGGGGGDCGGGF